MNRSRYQDALESIPPVGQGRHPALLGIANLGVLAGLDGQRIFRDIQDAMPQGNQRIPDREIHSAINKALSDYNGGVFIPKARPEPIIKNGKAVLQRIIEQGKYSDEADLWEASSINLYDKPRKDTILLLETLYKQDDLLWMGERYDTGIIGDTIRSRNAWISYFEKGGIPAAHIIPNPLNGVKVATKNGEKPTLRGDNNVKEYRFCMAEFDNLTREDQIRFWSGVKLPIVCLIDSGGRSIHAWIQISKLVEPNITTSEQWQADIKEDLYAQLLTPMGVDGACSNPARLSRLPGHYRQSKRAWQRLLWLSPEGREIC